MSCSICFCLIFYYLFIFVINLHLPNTSFFSIDKSRCVDVVFCIQMSIDNNWLRWLLQHQQKTSIGKEEEGKECEVMCVQCSVHGVDYRHKRNACQFDYHFGSLWFSICGRIHTWTARRRQQLTYVPLFSRLVYFISVLLKWEKKKYNQAMSEQLYGRTYTRRA